jgi:hypothetical protein
MKNLVPIIALLVLCFSGKSQSLTFTVGSPVCYNAFSPSTNTTTAQVISSPTNATSYSWTASTWSSNCGASFTVAGGGTAAVIGFPCCGPYTITCTAYNGTAAVGSAVQTVSVICSNNINVTSPNGFASCNGSSVTMIGSGGSNYVWTYGTLTLSTTGTVVVTPTANACYTLNVTGNGGCTLSIVKCVTVVTTPTVSISGVSSTTANCQNTGYTVTASGASSYSWYPTWLGNNATAATYLYASACFTVIGSNGGACTGSAVICPSITPMPTLNITASPSQTVCAGTTVTLSATSGPTSYTWESNYVPIGNGPTIAVTPTNYPNMGWNSYTLFASNPNGCPSYAHIFLYLSNASTISVSGSTQFCSGQSRTLSVSGSGTFTWSSASGTLGTGNSIVVSPTSSSCYTASNGTGCPAVVCLNMVSPPSLTVTATPSSTSNCAYSGFTLSASGASSYSWFYASGGNFANSANTVVGPASNSCYTVVGTTAPGCTASAGICVTVQPGPSLAISVSPGLTVCPGTPINLSGSGASNYTYALTSYSNNISTSSTASFIASSGTYSVWVTGTNSQGCPSYSLVNIIVYSGPGISGVGTGFVCPGGSKTLFTTASGPFTWSDPSGVISTSSFVVVSPTATTCYTLTAGTGTCSTSVACISPANGPTITATGYNFCQGSPGYLSVGGGTFYSVPGYSTTNSNWIPIGTVNANTCITVTGIGSNGCTGTAVACVTVTPKPVFTNTMSLQSVCPGQSVLLGTANTTVNWYVAQLSQWSVLPVMTHTGTSVVFTPTAGGVYSVTAYLGQCYPSFITTVNIVPNPTLSVTGGNTVCAGGTLTLSGWGANSYSWSSGQTGPNITVSPSASTCFSLAGTNNFGCTGMAVHCVSVMTVPVLIGPSSATVCRGTSQTFSASGAATYTWSNLATSSTINVMPQNTTSYSVTGTASNGCQGMAVVTLSVDSTCSDVWPGDANSDGIVGTTDVLEVGLQASATGSARNPGGNTYAAQRCSNWSGTISSGKNKCHADCDGSGTVDNSDLTAITANFSQTHAFRSSGSSGHDIRVVSDQPYFVAGVWNRADIVVGDASNPFNIYGLTFDLDYSANVVDPGQSYMVYNSSFLNANNQNAEFIKYGTSGGKVYAATVRTDHNNVLGHGKIGELYFKLAPGTEGQFMNFNIGNSVWTDNTGVLNTLGGNSISIQILADETGLAESGALPGIRLLPNPASQQVTLLSEGSAPVAYVLSDISGRILGKGEFARSTEIQTADLAPGVYFIRCESGGKQRTQRLVIQH